MALVIRIRRGVEKSRRGAATCPCSCAEEVLHFVLRHLALCPGCRGAPQHGGATRGGGALRLGAGGMSSVPCLLGLGSCSHRSLSRCPV